MAFQRINGGAREKDQRGTQTFFFFSEKLFLLFGGPQKRLQEKMNFDRDLLGKHGEFYKTHKVRKKHVVDIFTVME